MLTRKHIMTSRTYPSYWMYKDNKGEWRWTYEASNAKTIAVSSEGYVKRSDCERSIEIMKASTHSQVWLPTDLVNAA
ncbi:YegP family protein [Agrobacterium tumefaciens]|uniref:YegP family protein n=3 Tax=Rhizobiaceae TaxID=82115 RepID=UPI003977DFA3